MHFIRGSSVAVLIWILGSCNVIVGGAKESRHEFMSLENLLKQNFRWEYVNYLYKSSNNVKGNPAIVSNLNNYISNMGSQRCFIGLNNFQGADIIGLNSPVRITRPKVISRLLIGQRGLFDQLLFYWTSPNIASGNTTLKPNAAGLVSKFIIGIHSLSIALHSFVGSAKPWNCEMHFGLFPPIALINEIRKYPQNFQYKRSVPYTVPSGVSSIYVFVVHKVVTKDLAQLQAFIINLVYLGTYNFHFTVDIYLMAEVESPSLAKTCVYGEHFVNIDCLRLLRLSYKRLLKNPDVSNRLVNFVVVDRECVIPGNSSNGLHWASSAPKNEILVWHMIGNTARFPCGRFQSNWYSRPLSDWRADMWLSIFGNYSVAIGNGYHCENGKIAQFEVSMTMPYSPLVLKWITLRPDEDYEVLVHRYQEKFGILRFVSCSEVRVESLLYRDLTAIYESRVWAVIIITMMAVAITHAYLGRRGSVSTNLFAVFKILTGQGDPYTHPVFNRDPLRLVTVPILFMGVILSEGYKNSNVYNMVTPRKVVSYESFSEIVKDNFSIYTRIGDITFDLGWFPNTSTAYYYPFSSHIIQSYPSVFKVYSEFYTKYNFQSNWTMGEFIKAHSKLHPSLFSFAKQTSIRHQHWFNIYYNNSMDTIANYSQILKQLVTTWEEREMLQFLQTCNSTAIILPDYECLKYAKRLIVPDDKHVSIGKERYPTLSTGVNLKGLLPPEVWKRVKRIEVSGIWNFQEQVALRQPDFRAAPQKPTKARMDGNIVVVFLMLPTGFGVALAALLAEYTINVLITFSSRNMHRMIPVGTTIRSQPNAICELSTLLVGVAELVRIQAHV